MGDGINFRGFEGHPVEDFTIAQIDAVQVKAANGEILTEQEEGMMALMNEVRAAGTLPVAMVFE